MALKKQRGFSLLEMLTVVSIGFILTVVGFITMMPMLNESHVDSAYSTTLMALRNTRNMAIVQSNEYYVYFCPIGTASCPNPSPTTASLQVMFQGAPPTVGAAFPPPVWVNTYTLPPDINFALQAGFPNAAAAAPDQLLDIGVTAVDFGYGLTGEPLNYVVFYPDGSSRDGNQINGYSLGNYNSGIVYLTRPVDTMYSSRAVTVMGATGRIRGWRLYDISNVPTWVQQ